MMRPRPSRSFVYALYANAALLAAILLVLLSRGSGSGVVPSAYGAVPSPVNIAGSNGVYVMPAQFLSNLWGCYIVDNDNQTLCAYAYYGGNAKPELRLMAARNIRWDRKINSFNTGPDPDDIRKELEVQQEPRRGVAHPAKGEHGAGAPQTQPAGESNH